MEHWYTSFRGYCGKSDEPSSDRPVSENGLNIDPVGGRKNEHTLTPLGRYSLG